MNERSSESYSEKLPEIDCKKGLIYLVYKFQDFGLKKKYLKITKQPQFCAKTESSWLQFHPCPEFSFQFTYSSMVRTRQTFQATMEATRPTYF